MVLIKDRSTLYRKWTARAADAPTGAMHLLFWSICERYAVLSKRLTWEEPTPQRRTGQLQALSGSKPLSPTLLLPSRYACARHCRTSERSRSVGLRGLAPFASARGARRWGEHLTHTSPKQQHRSQRTSPMEIDWLRAGVAARVIVKNHAAPEVGAHRKPQDKKPQQD